MSFCTFVFSDQVYALGQGYVAIRFFLPLAPEKAMSLNPQILRERASWPFSSKRVHSPRAGGTANCNVQAP